MTLSLVITIVQAFLHGGFAITGRKVDTGDQWKLKIGVDEVWEWILNGFIDSFKDNRAALLFVIQQFILSDVLQLL